METKLNVTSDDAKRLIKEKLLRLQSEKQLVIQGYTKKNLVNVIFTLEEIFAVKLNFNNDQGDMYEEPDEYKITGKAIFKCVNNDISVSIPDNLIVISQPQCR